jgi:ABC-2 type transport system ATP-binding protein
MLQITNLSKVYSGKQTPAVDNLTLEVYDGEIFGFIGPNGAGKSTTIKCITGILAFTGGTVTVNGAELKKQPMTVKSQIGYVSDDHMLYDRLSGNEFINFMCDIFEVSSDDRRARLKRLADLFALSDALDKPIKGYSHGMKQKLNIIGALIHNPKLWILDEPMTGLDPQAAYNLKQLMKEHAAAGNSVFFSSHVLDVVEKICDRVGIIDGGRLIKVCTVDELQSLSKTSSLEELFLKITGNPAGGGVSAEYGAFDGTDGGLL